MLDPQQLATLLLRVAVAASLASILSRFSAFQRMLMRQDRTLLQRFQLALSCAAPYGASVALRVLNVNYQAVDLGMEGSLVAGMVGGYVTGLLSGVLISIPAFFINHELMSMPFSLASVYWEACCATSHLKKRTFGGSRRCSV